MDADLLPGGITWRYYAPSAGSIWTAPNAIQHICQSTGPGGECVGPDWSANVDLKPADVLSDVAACNLRSISWVIPTGANSDHAKVNDGGGPSWVSAIVNAIGNSSTCDNNAGYWRNTAIVIAWDDWGGWYDHVAPPIRNTSPPLNSYEYGFRVPLIVISPYAKAATVSHQQNDFGSILKFIEETFSLPTTIGESVGLEYADSYALGDLSDFFNFNQTPLPFTVIPAVKDAKFFIDRKEPPTPPDND